MNDSTDITRVELRVAPGAELAVDEMTAAQLGSRFKDPDEVAARDADRLALADPLAKKAKKKAADAPADEIGAPALKLDDVAPEDIEA